MSIINPAFLINPNIKDESGTTIDLGFRGIINDIISFDLTAFQMFYNNRIGFIQREFNDGSVKSERGNIGNANIYGLESNIDIDLNKAIEIISVRINKGVALNKVLKVEDFDFIICIGDDISDEYMFNILPDESVTIKVGNKNSNAKYFIKNSFEVRKLLENMIS